MSWMLFKKHEILVIQHACIATHTAVYSVLPHSVILVLLLFFLKKTNIIM